MTPDPNRSSLRRVIESECNRRYRVQLADHVAALRAARYSWDSIGEDFGISGQTVANWFADDLKARR